MSSSSQPVARLQAAIKALRPGDENPPSQVVSFWDEILRMTLSGWAAGLERDLRRVANALGTASAADGRSPTDDEVAALEECLWRIASGTEKVDALISLAFGGKPFVVVADKPEEMDMRPSRDRNKERLKELGSPAALALNEARGALAGERARLRRHQIMHSLAPIQKLDDLGPFIRVHHRDGRPWGYELVRWTPARWDEGITELTPETLFTRRLQEARQGLKALLRTVGALAHALEEVPVARVPQYVHFDHDTATYATEQPSPTGPPKRFAIDFLLDGSDPVVRRRVSSPSKVTPGEEIPFDDGLWRVIRVVDGSDGSDQTAICRLMESEE